jgi:hypothetical protein
VETLLGQKESGTAWETVFQSYRKGRAVFTPRSFDSDYLEQLLATPNFTADDVMIADHVSFVAGISVQDVVTARLQAGSWQEYDAKQGLLFSSTQLPRVQVAQEQLAKYEALTHWTDERIVEAMVLAGKTGLKPDDVVSQLMNGATEEAVYAAGCQAKYYTYP